MKKVQFTTVIPVHVLCFYFVDVFRNNEYEYATTKTVVGYKNTVKLAFNLHYNLSLILGQNWNAHINVHTQIAKECFNCGFALCGKGQNRDDNFPQILLASYDSYITRVQKS